MAVVDASERGRAFVYQELGLPPPRQPDSDLEVAVDAALLTFEWGAAFVILFDVGLGQVADWVVLLCCVAILSMVLLRAAPPLLEGSAAFALGLVGIALHVPAAAERTALGVIAAIVFAGLLLSSVFRLFSVSMRGCGRSCCDAVLLRMPDWLRSAQADMAQAAAGMCCDCCVHCIFGTVRYILSLLFHLLVLLLAATAIVYFVSEDLCAVDSFYAEMLLPANALTAGRQPPMEVGTPANIDLGGLPLDFTGIWWIRWTEAEPIPLYAKMHTEELVSMAGMYHRADDPANVTLPVPASSPTGLAGHWAFSNTLVGRIAMMTVAQKDPAALMNFFLENGTHAFIYGGGDTPWTMDKIDEDQWLRTITRADDDNWHYTLTRVVFADGSPHPQHFPAFVRHMEGTQVRVFRTSSRSCRECGALPLGSCSKCAQACAAA